MFIDGKNVNWSNSTGLELETVLVCCSVIVFLFLCDNVISKNVKEQGLER